MWRNVEHSQTEKVKKAINKFKKQKLFCGPLVSAALYAIVEKMDINCGLLSKHLFQRTQNGGFANLWVTINLYEKCLLVITWHKNYSSKQVISMIYTFGKDFLQLLLLKVCETFLFKQSNKVYSILWSARVFFAFLEKRRPNRYWLWEENLVFHMQIFILMCQSIHLFSKIAVQNVDWDSPYFCGGHKNSLRL